MNSVWQWAWNRHGPRFSWTVFVIVVALSMPTYLFWSFLIVAVEQSGEYGEAAVITVAGITAMAYVNMLPGIGPSRVVDRWAAGLERDRASALSATYDVARRASVRVVAGNGIGLSLLSALVAATTGTTGWRTVQYGILGLVMGLAFGVGAMHSFGEGAIRPARVAIAGGSGLGDSLPRVRPTFATWSKILVVSVVFVFAVFGAMLSTAAGDLRQNPLLYAGIGCALMVAFGVPLTVGAEFSASMQPIKDLAEGTKRVAAGDYSQRLPVVQDDDLGALAASFNRMQAGLAERQRLQSAFGAYVDPTLAALLLEQADDVFAGERRVVTVMFVDIRDFTAWAEANTAEDAVARLNALFEIVVPAVTEAGGHVNKLNHPGFDAHLLSREGKAHHGEKVRREVQGPGCAAGR